MIYEHIALIIYFNSRAGRIVSRTASRVNKTHVTDGFIGGVMGMAEKDKVAALVYSLLVKSV